MGQLHHREINVFNCVQVMNESVSTQISLPKKALQGSLVIRWI